MKDNINFSATNETFKNVFAKGVVFEVPPFQRDFSWTTDELDDLWEDLVAAKSEKSSHYMGYLVFQECNDKKKWRIIDGQQRITSISILIAVVLKKIKDLADTGDDDAKKRYDALHSLYLGYLDPVSLVTDPKVTLNRHNNSFFQEHVVALSKFPSRGIIDTNKLIKKAFLFFEDKIQKTKLQKSEEYAQFIEDAVDTFFFTVISVSDELNAFRVFETLNARGVQLSSSDLLKNYILSIVFESGKGEAEFKKVEEKWEKIVNTLGTEKFPEFLRYYWNSRHKTVRKAELFKAIRREVIKREDVFLLIKKMHENADLYVALQNSEDEMWREYSSQCRKDIDCLSMFNIKQHIPLLFTVFEFFQKKDFEQILHWLMLIAFRWNIICEYQTNDQERVYNEISLQIFNGEMRKTADLKQALARVYPSDEVFTANFATKSMNIENSHWSRIVKYILCEIEKQKSSSSPDYHSADLSIEHIFPENPEAGWPDFMSETDGEMVFHLGNYTLLPRAENRDLGSKTYLEKRPVYLTSCYQITREVGVKYENWTVSDISKRQRELASLAKTIWKIS